MVGKPDPKPIVETPSTARRTKDKRDERQGREKREKERERERVLTKLGKGLQPRSRDLHKAKDAAG